VEHRAQDRRGLGAASEIDEHVGENDDVRTGCHDDVVGREA
jgi:hypothetical protein